MSVPPDAAMDLNYIIWANDTSSNLSTSAMRVVKVVDNDMPILVTDLTPTSGTTGDQFTFTVEVMDNVGIGQIDEIVLNDASNSVNGAIDLFDMGMFFRLFDNANQRGVDNSGRATGLTDNCICHF